jgi:hypothetical protein
MRNFIYLTLIAIESFLVGCRNQVIEKVQVAKPNVLDSVAVKADTLAEGPVRLFLMDSTLEIKYNRYKKADGRIVSRGVSLIDNTTGHWLFDSEGPQIESNSDLQKIDDSQYMISVYYDVPFSPGNVKKEVRVAKYDLRLHLASNKYEFEKDTVFRPTPPPFNSIDIQKTISDYNEQISIPFKPDSTNNDLPYINRMFEVQESLLSSFISGCDSCEVYAHRLFQKFDPALFASDSDYAGEILSVYRIMKNRRLKAK